MNNQLTVNRMLHFHCPDLFEGPRPALVTSVHSDTCCNMRIFLDGSDIGKLAEVRESFTLTSMAVSEDGGSTAASMILPDGKTHECWVAWPPRV